jgi:Transposase, Mutator family
VGLAAGDGVAVSGGVGNSSKARAAEGRMPSTWAGHQQMAMMGDLMIRLERLNGEVKRRTDVVGIFPNDADDEWAVQRARYTTLETMAALSDDPSDCRPW